MAPGRANNRRGRASQHTPVPTSARPDAAPVGGSGTNNDNSNDGRSSTAAAAKPQIFLDPMMGNPLQVYIEKDVEERNELVDLVQEHGGIVSTGYGYVPYILVDPCKESGQNLHRQYAGKKGKVVLDARWIRECVNAGQLQAFMHDWAGCKVTGNERAGITEPVASVTAAEDDPARRETRQGQTTGAQDEQAVAHIVPPQAQAQTLGQSAMAPQSEGLVAPHGAPFPYEHMHPGPLYPYPPRVMPGGPGGPPQTWHAPNGIAPLQTQTHAHQQMGSLPGHPQAHMMHRAQAPLGHYRHDAWDGYAHPHPSHVMMPGPSHAPYGWVGPPGEYYPPQYHPAYPPPEAYMNEAGPSNEAPPPQTNADGEDGGEPIEPAPRGRKRVRGTEPAPPASSLVLSRRNPNARSPTPPTRVIKSTYGGNLFTSDDILYLKRYIDYCQEQGLVLSLREICERIAIKAPHHTFYSWRRYCNKHQIRLGGYAMAIGRPSSPNGHIDPGLGPEGESSQSLDTAQSGQQEQQPHPQQHPQPHPGQHPQQHPRHHPQQPPQQHAQQHPLQHPPQHLPPHAQQHSQAEQQMMVEEAHHQQQQFLAALAPAGMVVMQPQMQPEPEGAPRDRSPTPPRALFRSTTGKGVAFTDDDVRFLVRFLEYRKSQGRMDMVTFWKDVAAKAPHHSRASWMKFYGRHKHELFRTDADAPIPRPPEKKLRYSRGDDVLLARYFSGKPEGTVDKIFQEFARMHPHHPWKGWQEHHRIHKAEIDHLVHRLANGEDIDVVPDAPAP